MLPPHTTERPTQQQHAFGYLLCCSANVSPHGGELVIPRSSERARARQAQNLFCWQRRTENLSQETPRSADGVLIAPPAAAGSSLAAAGPEDVQRLPYGEEAAARLIQSRWRHRGQQVKAASLIQTQWRRRCETRTQLSATKGEANGNWSGQVDGFLPENPLDLTKVLPKKPLKTLHRAASQIQRLWRQRGNSRDTGSSASPIAGRGVQGTAPSGFTSEEASEVGPLTPRPSPAFLERLPVGATTTGQAEASPFADAVGRAAAIVQSMWRPASLDQQSTSPETSPAMLEASPSGRLTPRIPSTPIAHAFNDAASRLQNLWRNRLPSGADEEAGGPPMGPTLSEQVANPEKIREHFEWFVGKVKNNAAASEPLLKAWWQERKRRALQTLLNTSQPVLKRTLADIGEVVKTSVLSDPDMWQWVRASAHSAVAEVWNDIQMEIEEGLKVSLIQQSNHFDRPPTASNPIAQRWLLARSWVLFHYLPYNKSIFGKLKDPGYICMTASTMLPVFGIRVFFFSVILAMLLLPGPPDEYQLINFILILKGTQFFTTGVGMMFLGAMKYYICYLFHGDELRDCIVLQGPGAADWFSSAVFDYFGTITLVWVAFLALPRSNVHWSGHRNSDAHKSRVYCCCLKGVPTRGGRLRWLLRYDMVTFVFSFLLFLMIYLENLRVTLTGPSEKWNRHLAFVHAKETIFWCRILYSVFSLPFVIFVIPLFGRVLTHSVYTGYNQDGACVEFNFEPMVVEEQPELVPPEMRRAKARSKDSKD